MYIYMKGWEDVGGMYMKGLEVYMKGLEVYIYIYEGVGGIYIYIVHFLFYTYLQPLHDFSFG